MKKKVLSKIKKKIPPRIKLSPLGARRASAILNEQAEKIFPIMFFSGGLRRQMTFDEKKTYIEVLVNTTREERKILTRLAHLLRDRQRRMGRALVK